MDELENVLGSLLKDPAQLQKLSALASQLMSGAAAAEEPPPPPENAGGGDPARIARLAALFSGAQSGSREKTALLQAMRPFLSAERQERLERAMRFASMAKLAGTVMRELGGTGHV